MTSAPIALFVYNRPAHTRRAVEALQRNRRAAATDLFIYSDAPKKPEAAAAVQAVRDYICTVGGFRTVTLVERAENQGLARSIIDGVTRLCAEHGRVIVLEDDLETSPHFLEYMNTALKRYEADERVMQIAGYMFSGPLEIDDDALLLPFISSWGWATWQRSWRHFDANAAGYGRLQASRELRRRFDLDGHYNYFRMLRAQQEGRIDSWAIRWYLSVFLRNGLALYPRKTLVRNLGLDGSGVNCAVSDIVQDDVEDSFRVERLPTSIDVSPDAGQVFRNMPVARLSLTAIRNRLAAVFGGQRL